MVPKTARWIHQDHEMATANTTCQTISFTSFVSHKPDQVA
jgi:hypothetical protein